MDEREKDPAFVSDAYAECYPGYHDYNNTIVDSDDEADYSHMDSKYGKGRTDFQTEEEWQVGDNGALQAGFERCGGQCPDEVWWGPGSCMLAG